MAIVYFSIGAIFMIRLSTGTSSSGSAMGQGLYDLAFRAYLVKFVPSEEEKASAFGPTGKHGQLWRSTPQAPRRAKSQEN